MIRLSILIAFLIISGCASNTRIVAIGVGEYMVYETEKKDSWWSSRDNGPDKLYERASNFCGEEKAVEEIKTDPAADRMEIVPSGSGSLRFRCKIPAL